MSNHVVRLSGSHSGNAVSVKNLVAWLRNIDGCKFMVVSAVHEILESVYHAVEHATDIDTQNFTDQYYKIFTESTGIEVSSSYSKLVGQLKAIIKGIKLTGDYSDSLKDQIAGFSEQLTVEIFKVKLAQEGIKAEVLLPEQIELSATDDYGNATFLSINKEWLLDLKAGYYLIPGSYGITSRGKVSRAGRTAADYTAAFLTRKLEISRLELWGIDKAFKRADNHIIADAPVIERLTYSEASELAYFDHYSFHPRTVEPLESEHIPVVVMNTESDKGEVDTIVNTETFVEEQIVKSVACSDDISLIRLNGPGVGLKPGILARVTTQLNQAGINIRSVITSQISINLILEKSTGTTALNLINQLGFTSVKDISLIEDVSLIGIIGHGMQQNYGVSARIFSAVAQHKVNVILSGSGASDLVSYLVVKTADKVKSVKEIYHSFFNHVTLEEIHYNQ